MDDAVVVPTYKTISRSPRAGDTWYLHGANAIVSVVSIGAGITPSLLLTIARHAASPF